MKRITREGSTPGSTITTVIVEEPVLSMENVNGDVFEIGSEEGSDSDDNMLSMIGDATQKHVDSLSVRDRLAWEHFIHTSNGNLFFRTPDTRFNDRDELNLRVEDLDTFFENYKIPEGMRSYYEEAIQEERDRREAVMIGSVDDVYNNNQGLVSFQEWEEFPQMMSHVDIPSTPKDRMFYSGNTKQPFYDYFPEGHPDTKVLNQFITMVNRDIDEFNPKFVEFMHKFVDSNPMRNYTRKVLHKVSDYLIDAKNYNELIIQMLQAIDRNWAKAYKNKVIERTLEEPMVKLMVAKNNEFEALKDAGINPAQQVKDFGSVLFRKFRRGMNSTHWHLYKRLKSKYQVEVFLKGVDVNTASIQDLRKVVSNNKARDIWFARPFQTAVELHTKGLIDRRMLTDNENADKVLDLIVRLSEQKDLEKFNALASRLVAKQHAGKITSDQDSWKNIWTFYRMTKSSLIKELKDGKGQRKEVRTGSV